MSASQVCPPIRKMTDADARHYLADGLIRVCHEQGPSRVALEIGCDEKTVRRARDEESTLGLASFVNLAAYDPAAVAPLLAQIGFRLAAIDADDNADLTIPCIVTRFLLALSVALEDGRLDHIELAKMRPHIDALGGALDGLRERMKPRAA